MVLDVCVSELWIPCTSIGRCLAHSLYLSDLEADFYVVGSFLGRMGRELSNHTFGGAPCLGLEMRTWRNAPSCCRRTAAPCWKFVYVAQALKPFPISLPSSSCGHGSTGYRGIGKNKGSQGRF